MLNLIFSVFVTVSQAQLFDVRQGVSGVSISSSSIPPGSTHYIQNGDTLQTPSSFYVQLASATEMRAGNGSGIAGLNAGNLASGTVPNARLDASSATLLGPSIDIVSETTGILSGGRLGGGSTNYVQIGDTLQTGATFYTSSGTVNNFFSQIVTASQEVRAPTFTATGSAFIVGRTTITENRGFFAGVIESSAANVSGQITAGSFIGDGSGLSGVGSTDTFTTINVSSNIYSNGGFNLNVVTKAPAAEVQLLLSDHYVAAFAFATQQVYRLPKTSAGKQIFIVRHDANGNILVRPPHDGSINGSLEVVPLPNLGDGAMFISTGTNAYTATKFQTIKSSANAVFGLTYVNASSMTTSGELTVGTTMTSVGVMASTIVANAQLCLVGDCRTTWPTSGFVGTATSNLNMTGFSITGVDDFVSTGGVTASSVNVTGAFFQNGVRIASSSGQNAFFGVSNGENVTTGNLNTSVGVFAGQQLTTGGSNVFMGRTAGQSNTSGSRNIYLGVGAGAANIVANDNVSIGFEAGMPSVNAGSENVFVGNQAGQINQSAGNVMVGFDAGRANVSGSSNTFVGYEAGELGTFGANNVFIGFRAGKGLTGESNTLAIEGGTSQIRLIEGNFNDRWIRFSTATITDEARVNGNLFTTTATASAAYKIGSQIAFSSVPVHHAGGFSPAALASGTTFSAFVPDSAISIRRVSFAVTTAGTGGSGDNVRCGSPSAFVSAVSGAAAAAGSVSSGLGTALIPAGTTVYMWLNSDAATTPGGNVNCEYVHQ